MATAGSIGSGTTFTWHAQLIGELTSIGGVELTVDKLDGTTLDTADFYREYVAGLIDPSDIEIEGSFDPDDTGQALLWTDIHLRANQTWLITFPAAVSGATFTGTGFISHFKAGAAGADGIVPFSARITPTDKPTFTP